MKGESVLFSKGLFVEEGQEIDADPLDEITIRVVDFLEEFTKAVWDSLGRGEKKYGNEWLASAKDHEVSFHSMHRIKSKFERFVVDDKPIDWAGVAGYAMIAWIRETHPELWANADARCLAEQGL